MGYSIILALLSFAGGLLAHFAMAPTNFAPALFIGLPALYYALQRAERKRITFLFTWLFSFGYFVTSLSWIANALLVPGNEDFYWAYPLALGGLPAGLALFPAIIVTFFIRKFDLEHISGWFMFVFAFSLSEVARGFLFTGFPWNNVGYTWISVPAVAQIASIGGIYFLSALTIFWATTPALMFLHKRGQLSLLILLITLSSMSGAFLWGSNRLAQEKIHTNPDVMVHIIQPNVIQETKWQHDKLGDHYRTLVTLSKESLTEKSAKTNLIIWPETAALPTFLFSNSPANPLQEILPAKQQNYLLTGALRSERRQNKNAYFNSLMVLGGNIDILGVYDKHHLVPFGEYIPFQQHIPLAPVTQFNGLQAGRGLQKLYITDALSISPLVCYEIIFPDQVIPEGISRPNLIVNVTNDAWYGNSAGPRQHLVQAQFRAIETGIPVARSANTGISALISPLGTILSSQSYGIKGYQNNPLPLLLQNENYFAKFKHKFVLAFLFLTLCMSYITRQKK